MPYNKEETAQRFAALASHKDQYGNRYFGLPNLGNPAYKLTVGRSAAATMTFGELLLKNKDITLDELLDESKNAEMRMEAGAEVLRLYNAMERSSNGTVIDGPNTAAFEKRAAEAYVAVAEAGKRYINERVTGDFTLENLLEPKNEKLISAIVISVDAMQELDRNKEAGNTIGDTASTCEAVQKAGGLDPYLDGIANLSSVTNAFSLFRNVGTSVLAQNNTPQQLATDFSNSVMMLTAVNASVSALRNKPGKQFTDADILQNGVQAIGAYVGASAGRDLTAPIIPMLSTQAGRERFAEDLSNGKLLDSILDEEGNLKPQESIRDYADTYLIDAAEQHAAYTKAVTSWTHYGYTDEENNRLNALDAPVGIDRRICVAAFSMKELMDKGFTVDEILDPENAKVREALPEVRRTVTERFEKGCSDSEADRTAFTDYVADSYLKLSEASEKYILERSRTIQKPADLLEPENKNVLAVKNYLHGIMQDVTKRTGNKANKLETFAVDTIGKDGFDTLCDRQLSSCTVLIQMENTLDGALNIAGKGTGDTINATYIEKRLADCGTVKDLSEDAWTNPAFSMGLFKARDEMTKAIDLQNKEKYAEMQDFLKSSEAKTKLARDMITGSVNSIFTKGPDDVWNAELPEYLEKNGAAAARESLINVLKQEAVANGISLRKLLDSKAVGTVRNGVTESFASEAKTADTIDKLASALSEGNELYVFRPGENGPEGHRISLNGTSAEISEQKTVFMTVQQKALLKDKLMPLVKTVMDTGVTRGDSDEFTEMRKQITAAAEMIEKTDNYEMIRDAVKDMREAADAYYTAKLGEAHNSRRSTRFTAAAQLRVFGNIPEKNEIDIEKRAIAAKAVKGYLDAQIKTDLKNAPAFEKLLNDEKSFENTVTSLQKTPAFRRMVDGKSFAQLKSISTKKGLDIYKDVENSKAPKTAQNSIVK